jgi:hypothetical protein
MKRLLITLLALCFVTAASATYIVWKPVGTTVDGYIEWSAEAAGPDWSPTNFANCILWLDAADSSTISTDLFASVSQWSDKSAASNHFVQGTASYQPKYTKDQYVYSIYLNGNSRYFKDTGAALVGGSGNRTWLIVWSCDPTAVHSWPIKCGEGGPNGANYNMVQYTSGGMNCNVFGGATTWSVTCTGVTNYVIFATVLNGSQMKDIHGWFNGVDDGVGSSTRTLNTESQTWLLHNDNTDKGQTTRVREIILYSRALSDAEVIEASAALATKWGL